ncbi:MAG: fibronectin type III domain-containing protein [Prolixibacteraceae bacterium]|nr:fibronectin type III domain-containing protein [Prolixibacteraceae bacterium]
MKSIYKKFKKRILLTIIIASFSMISFSATYYVSSSGNDSNSGLTTSMAWKTLAKINSTSFKAGDLILFQRGDAFYGSLIVNNSGIAGSPITFGSYGTGNNPIITGFTSINSGWKNEGGGIYSIYISAESSPQMVTIDGVQYAMGRWPNTTWRTITGVSGSTQISDSGLNGTPNWTGAEVVIRKNRWIIDRSTISSQNTTQLNFAAGSYNAQNGWGYFIQNSLSTLDTFGEWYYNPKTSTFYMYFGAIDPLTKTVKVSSVDKLIYSNGSKYITIDGIALTGSNLGAIYRNSPDYTASNFIIQNCDISFSGNYAVFGERSSTMIVSNTTITTTNNTAILLDGNYGTSNKVNNCTITNTATIPGLSGSGDMQGLAVKSTVSNTLIEYNNIINTGYIPIYFGGVNTIVQNNFLDTFCSIKDDGGGIYSYHDVTANKKVLNNIILHSNGAFGTVSSSGTPDVTSSGRGLYSDQLCKNIEYSGNTIAYMSASAIHVNTSDILTIKNNTIFQTLSYLDINRWSSSWFTDSISVTDNIIISTVNKEYPNKGNFWYSVQTSSTYLDGGTIDYEVSKIGAIDNNYIYSNIDHHGLVYTSASPYTLHNFTLEQWKNTSGFDTHSTFVKGNTDPAYYRFEYNATKSLKTISLSNPMIDAKGVKYSKSITLQPYTSVVLMNDLTVAAVPSAPTSVVASAGNASVSVTFVAPASDGGSAITGYTVTSIPAGGIDSNAGSTSLTHKITGLTNGTSYTFTVKATNSVGTSVASIASNLVIPTAPVATSFTFTGPSSGNVNSPSANFTVTPNNVYTGTITITPTGAGSAGLSSKVLTFSNSSTAQTFSITPTVAGSITLMPTNNGTLTNPSNLIYNAKAILPDAPTSVAATAGDASALVTFVAPTNTGGSAITGYTVTSIPAGGVDTNAGSTSLTHSIGGLTNGTSYTFTVKAINSIGSSVASIASNSITPKTADVITKQGDIIPSHFKTVWEGLNGLNHMNINVVSATLEDVPLSVDDEIAVFSGLKCVGTTKLTKSIVSSDNTTFLSILASQDDGSGNGFSDNDTIVFKIWDSKTQSELQVNGVVYRNDVSTWKTNGRYSPGATTVVEIASYSVITQSIELLKGYNMISTYVSVQNPNVSAVTKSLQDQGSLIKMQDETGNSFENWGDFGGWINQLGTMEETEGYKIQVANNCTLQVTGRSIAMPFDISLKTGWNIISYPRTDMVNAMNVFQTLIDQNKLVKVQDEAGNSIENWGLFGGWKNGIGNLIPGKAYKVKISADAILTFQESYPKSAVVLAKAEQTEYYHSSVEGNGTDHMNINITGLNGIGISVGDEIAAFDGSLCVATTKITEANILSGAVSLASSFSTNDQNPNGFKVGDQIQISTWSKLSGDESKVNTEVITGQMKYEKNATVLVKMKSATIATAITNLNDAVKIDVFPNPCQDQVTVRFSKIPEADSRIEISDISGRKLITRPISGNTEEINLDSFTPGLYLVKSILGKNEYVQKLIVNK